MLSWFIFLEWSPPSYISFRSYKNLGWHLVELWWLECLPQSRAIQAMTAHQRCCQSFWFCKTSKESRCLYEITYILNVGNLKQEQSSAETSLIYQLKWARGLPGRNFWLFEPVGISELPNGTDTCMAGTSALLVLCTLRTGLARSKPGSCALFHGCSQQPDIF